MTLVGTAEAYELEGHGGSETDIGLASPGRHCHSTLSLAVIICHSLGIYTVVLWSLLSFSVKMKVSPLARQVAPGGARAERLGGDGGVPPLGGTSRGAHLP